MLNVITWALCFPSTICLSLLVSDTSIPRCCTDYYLHRSKSTHPDQIQPFPRVQNQLFHFLECDPVALDDGRNPWPRHFFCKGERLEGGEVSSVEDFNTAASDFVFHCLLYWILRIKNFRFFHRALTRCETPYYSIMFPSNSNQRYWDIGIQDGSSWLGSEFCNLCSRCCFRLILQIMTEIEGS